MNTTFSQPVVARVGAIQPDAPLVVLLHGRGSAERDIAALADHLPPVPAYAAVRASRGRTRSPAAPPAVTASPSRR